VPAVGGSLEFHCSWTGVTTCRPLAAGWELITWMMGAPVLAAPIAASTALEMWRPC
jgi:hypothetical protein